MRNRIAVFLFLLLILPIIGCAQGTDESNITVKQLSERIISDTNLVILDVRTSQELTGPLGKIDSVLNIPVQELNNRMNELDKYKDKPIAVICRSGNRSAVATKMLKAKGFNAVNVLGGMKAWNSEFSDK